MLDIIAAYDKLINSTTNLIRNLKAYPRILNGPEHTTIHLFFDKCLHNALNLNDLVIGLKYLDVSGYCSNDVEANYFARIVAHSTYEILNHSDKLFGRQVRNYIKTNVPNSIAIVKVEATLKSLNQVKKNNIDELNKIRNNTFGHKLENGLNQVNIILLVNNKYIYDTANSVYKINQQLLGNVFELMAELPK